MIHDALTIARDLLSSNKGSSSDIYTAISLMEKIKGANAAKFQRSFHVYLGRLYRRVKNYDAAIGILREYINTIETDPDIPPELKELAPANKAAALYNIACYHVLKASMAVQTSAAPELDRLIEEALQELDASLTLDPSNWVHATGTNETDFDVVKNNPDWNDKFCAIIEKAKVRA
jgi:tetratricopeptide (TPR) repeat protein